MGFLETTHDKVLRLLRNATEHAKAEEMADAVECLMLAIMLLSLEVRQQHPEK